MTKRPVHPYFLFGLIILFTITATGIYKLKNSQVDASWAEISYKENKFKINFHLTKVDDSKANDLLQKLELPQSVKQEIEFQLDNTTSTKLGFFTPAKANISLSDNQLKFDGKMPENPELEEMAIERQKIPTETNLAISSKDFRGFIKSKFKLPGQFLNWIDGNIKPNGQTLLVFGQDAQWAIIGKNHEANFEELKNIETEDGEPAYKVETQENVKYHIIKIPQDNDKDTTFVIVENTQWIYLASSKEAAQEIVKAQSQKDAMDFPEGNNKAALVILFNNKELMPTDSFYSLITENRAKIEKTLAKVEYLKFTVSARTFSGQISIK